MDSMDQGDAREWDDREWDVREWDVRERDPLRRQRGAVEPLDQRVDRWVSASRQFVEGVAGSRPGGRQAPRAGERRPPGRLRFDDLGRWVEDRLDWLLEDGDDWREPWQENERAGPPPPAPARSRRKGLQAVSRRGLSAGRVPQPPVPPGLSFDGREDSAGADDDWPDDASFTLPRWQRQEPAAPAPPPATGGIAPSSQPRSASGAQPGSRPLPRSSRRRS